jgi:hypothetical protein
MQEWIAALSAVLTVVALVGTWIGWRQKELRREEVHAWASEAITALQTLLLICLQELRKAPPAGEKNSRLEDVVFSTSILVERGRLFFRNSQPNAHGNWKEPAYRGFRPCILDHLVTAHQISLAWPRANASDRAKMRQIAEDCLKKFVSLAQKEVGRDRTASADTSRGGEGAQLKRLMAEFDLSRLPPPGKV